MKMITPTLILIFSGFAVYAQSAYEDALSHANYAYAHVKDAHNSNNREHVIEHSDKAVEAFYMVEELADQCGCLEAYEAAMDGRENAEKTATQDTYERSRFYAKRARAHGERMVALLNDCKPAGHASRSYIADNVDVLQEEIELQQARLIEKQRLLAQEQSRLEKEIAIQRQKQAEFEKRRSAELAQQNMLKSKAETALSKLEIAIKELGVVFNDDIAIEDYTRSEKELKNETLSETKYFYAVKASKIAKLAMDQFTEYAH